VERKKWFAAVSIRSSLKIPFQEARHFWSSSNTMSGNLTQTKNLRTKHNAPTYPQSLTLEGENNRVL